MRSSLNQQAMPVGLLVLWCLVLQAGGSLLAGRVMGMPLLWNLFLAAVPLVWSTAFARAANGNKPVLAAVYFAFWLLFLPNAPYILTDLIHLGSRPGVPEWYVLALLLSFAGAGTLLGYVSLQSVQYAVAQRFGAHVGWLVAGLSLMGCGYGIYLGRFLRWNSWDAVTRPWELVKTILRQFVDSGPYPHPVPVTLVFGIGLTLGYLAWCGRPWMAETRDVPRED